MLMDCASGHKRRPATGPVAAPATDDTRTNSTSDTSDTIITFNRDAIYQPRDGETSPFYDALAEIFYATRRPFYTRRYVGRYVRLVYNVLRSHLFEISYR